MIDLEKKYFYLLKKILDDCAPEYKALLFGSRVAGTAEKFSDIDIALIGPGKIGWKRLEEIKDAFAESDLPMIVDVIDYHSVSDRFKKEINLNHVVLGGE